MAAPESAVRRLQQTSNHLEGFVQGQGENLSIVHGPLEPALVDWTLGDLLDEQCAIRGIKECLIVPFSETRWTFAELQHQSKILAKGLLALGVRRGDRVGILAGNCEEYVAVFFAAGYIGAILVVLNSTYTSAEAQYALNHSGKPLRYVLLVQPLICIRLQSSARRRKVWATLKYKPSFPDRTRSHENQRTGNRCCLERNIQWFPHILRSS
jgi:mevalonyl-CoA ligase